MTIQDMIKCYGISLAKDPKTGKEGLWISNGQMAKRENAVDEIKTRKSEIMDYLKAEKAEEERARKERQDKINAIEGLKEIRAARQDLENWHYEFEKSFEDVGGLGVRAKPEYDFSAMKAQYPRAAAYLRAEAEANKSNYELAAIGRKALEEVIYGDWEKAMETMDAEINAFSEKHAWD